MEYKNLQTISNKESLIRIINSISGMDNYFIKNVILSITVSGVKKQKRLVNPVLIIERDIYLLPDELNFNIGDYQEILKDKNYYEASLLHCPFEPSLNKDIKIISNGEMLMEAMKTRKKHNNWLCHYYPKEEVRLELGYHIDVSKITDFYHQEEVDFISIYSADFVEYASLTDQELIFNEPISFENIHHACRENCIDLAIHGFSKIDSRSLIKK